MTTLIREVVTFPCPWCDEQSPVLVFSHVREASEDGLRVLRFKIEALYVLDSRCEHLDDWFYAVETTDE